MSTTRLHLVRHGEVHNPEKVLYGRIPGYRLSDLGLAMAGRVADHFGGRDVALVLSSPLTRAQQTAGPIAAAAGAAVETDDRLIEAGNHFEGLRVGHDRGRLSNPEHWPYLWNPFRPSWGEPYRDQVRRVTAAMHAARARAEGHEAVLVLHQLPIWVTRLSAEERPLWHDPRRRECNLCSVTTFDFVGPHLSGISYAEPAAELYDAAIDVTGTFEGLGPKESPGVPEEEEQEEDR